MPTITEYAVSLAALEPPALLEECRRQHVLDLRTRRAGLPNALIACWEECRRRNRADLYRTGQTLAEQDIVKAEREQAERVRQLNAVEGGTQP